VRFREPFPAAAAPISHKSNDYGMFTYARRAGTLCWANLSVTQVLRHYGEKSLIVDRMRHSIDMPAANGAA
jgi:hypothetical protein